MENYWLGRLTMMEESFFYIAESQLRFSHAERLVWCVEWQQDSQASFAPHLAYYTS